MRIESFKSAKYDIENFFLNNSLKAYTSFDLLEIFNTNRDEWNIAQYRHCHDFIKFLEDINILKSIKLKHQHSGSIKLIYSKPDTSHLDIGLTIKKNGYLSNYTAMQIHQLTLQIPKSIYVSYNKIESKNFVSNNYELLQEDVDRAFSKPQRITSESYKSENDNFRFFFIQKAFKETNIGIVWNNGITYTDLERTLIDICVRPSYSGGVFEVLEAFEKAKDKVDIPKLYKYLIALDYIYPYHQLIGFYMDRSGFNEDQTNLFLKNRSNYIFYLTYNMSNKEYNEKWNIYYPKGF